MLRPPLSALGFDPARLSMGFRTAIGCCIALFLAQILGLEHPQWAGMSVWAAAQPLRGQVFEKSAFRFLGTVIGTGVGICLVLLSQIEISLMVTALALWIGLCTWGAGLRRGIPGYGIALAGYSASLVALIDVGRPEQVLALGADRLATVLLGVLVGTLIAQAFAPGRAADGLQGRVRRHVARILRARAAGPMPDAEAQVLLAKLAALDESLDAHGAGSAAGRQALRAARRLVLAGTALVLEGENPPPAPLRDLHRLADHLEQGRDEAAFALCQGHPGLSDLALSLRALEAAAPAPLRVPQHSDPAGAREAGLRAFGAILIFGLGWALSGWAPGAFMLLGLSVMISVFSSFETPVLIMRHVLLGQVLAVAAMLICQLLLWPLVSTEMGQIAMMMPFLLLGPFLSAHRRTGIAALDFHMVFLLLSQPQIPFLAEPAGLLAKGLAVVAAPVLAWGLFALIWPAGPVRRLEHLRLAMLADLSALAASEAGGDHAPRSRSRLLLRALPAAAFAQKVTPGDPALLRRARAMLVLQNGITALQGLKEAPGREGRAARAALKRLEMLSTAPASALHGLRHIAEHAPAPIRDVTRALVPALLRAAQE
ncbi:FUSC family protein [Falsigemmobacter faecalis]|uniref:FUSC family protein n=1 Tax=Falsigemmobacter faecalis TaxID=2488730 RepID=A0A3P3DV39_9RHOB|nr:FUSC family protein [Falsigemmobacter faecalis]RRH78147.1 FUSC family protein [Falsigemmobacter faecalis]